MAEPAEPAGVEVDSVAIGVVVGVVLVVVTTVLAAPPLRVEVTDDVPSCWPRPHALTNVIAARAIGTAASSERFGRRADDALPRRAGRRDRRFNGDEREASGMSR